MTNKRKLLIILLLVMLALGYIGYDLSQLQAGLEKPNEAVLAASLGAAITGEPPAPITTYDSFSVAVEDSISVTVHIREASDPAANILMVHGAGGGAWAWEAYLEQLPATYNLYAVSWRGHFTSSPVDDANTADYVRDQAAVLAAIVQRNSLPIHVIGHSYGGATSVLTTAAAVDQVASLHLIAPVVPLNYTVTQKWLVPLILGPIIRNTATQNLSAAEDVLSSGTDTEGSGPYAGMFIDLAQMERYWDLHAGKPYSVEKPGLIGGDGLDPAWQVKLNDAYRAIGEAALPIWFLIARYDNVVIPGEQRAMADGIGAGYIELESGHYIQLDVKAEESAEFITTNLNALKP